MTDRMFAKVALCCFLLAAIGWSQPPGGRRAMFGDWEVKVPFGQGEMDVILSFRPNQDNGWTGQWITGWGVNELKDVTFEDGKLSFVHVFRFRDSEFKSTFTGTIADGKLTGTLASDRGDQHIEGQRRRRMSRAAGRWQLHFKIGDRDVTTTLVVTPDKEGQLNAEWQSQWGEHKVTDFTYERGAVSFKRHSTFQDRQMDSTFEGTIRGNTLTGTIKSDMGDIEVQGERAGAAVIGTWNLDVATEWGDVKQRLIVNGDMTGLYGTIPVQKVELNGDQVAFKMVVQFGDQDFEMDFAGKLVDDKLTGEMTTSRGTQKITGTKVVRSRRPRPNM